ncbi:MAG: DUF4358 domain-containing protein [Clostridiales bacterium]|nr:DUF4358 domain-containing protein [Clostridiales bacterium]
MRKKIMTMALAMMMAISISACGGNKDANKSDNKEVSAVGTESTTGVTTEENTTKTEATTEENKKKEENKKDDNKKEEVTETTTEATTEVTTTEQKEDTTVAVNTDSSTNQSKPSTTTKPNSSTNQSKPSTTTKPNGSTSQSKPSTTKPNKPSKPTTEKPSKPSNGKEEQKEDVSLTEIVAAVKKAYGDGYLPNMTIDQDVLAEQYGIKKSMYEEVIAEGPMLSFQIDTFIAVKAKEGKAEEVKAAMEKYKQYLLDESMQYPMNASKIPATQVYRFGNYVFFSMLVSPQGEEPESEEAYLEAAKKQNQIAYDTIAKFFS